VPDSAQLERVKERRAGTSGDFVLPEIPDASQPVRGALVPWHDGSMSFRPHKPFAASFVGSGDWLLVLADSGLWLLESETFAVRARVAPLASGDVVAAPDGARFAYGRCEENTCFVDIRTFPDLALVLSVAVDQPGRLRFSADGSLLAVASPARSSATVVSLADKSTRRLAGGNDVNDALIVSVEKDWIAFGTDNDLAVIQNWKTGAMVFNTRAAMEARSQRGFDQNAVAYDPKKDELLVGGNDDAVWRFGAISTGAPVFLGNTGFANDVEDLAILGNGDALVGLDSGSIDVWHVDGSKSSGVGRSAGFVSWGARLNVDSKENVVAVLGGTVLRWKLGEALVRQSPFFGSSHSWDKSYTREDVVLIGTAKDQSFAYVLQRASLKAADPLLVESDPIGTMKFETHSPSVLVLDDGTRLFAGAGPGRMLRVVRLPLGGTLSEPEDAEVPYSFGADLRKADGKRAGYQGGRMAAEIDAKGTRVLSTLQQDERLGWNQKKGGWEACDRACRPVP
jgi:hypothetical protein